jgi:hypothetical protein
MSAQKIRSRAALAVLAGLALMGLGCEVRSFRVQIPGFDTDAVQGIWVWRQSATGDFERFAQIRFTERVQSDGDEIQRFAVSGTGGGFTLQSLIERSGAGDATLELAFQSVPGLYKVTSYNAAGESDLSEGDLVQ